MLLLGWKLYLIGVNFSIIGTIYCYYEGYGIESYNNAGKKKKSKEENRIKDKEENKSKTLNQEINTLDKYKKKKFNSIYNYLFRLNLVYKYNLQ